MNITPRASAGRVCPQCGNDTPEEQGLRRWCDQCNWNVAAPRIIDEEGILSRKYVALGEGRGRSLLSVLIASPVEDLRPRTTLATATALFISAAIHLLSVTMLLFGVYVVLAGFPRVTSLLIGLACCALGWLSLPRPMRLPKNATPPQDFPALHALVNEIAAKLGGRPVKCIVVDEEFNASYAVAGWRREPVLALGLPIWIALRAPERLALIAHEIAHGVNGDSMRGFVIGEALRALGQWIDVFRGNSRPLSGIEALAGHLTRAMALPLAGLRTLLLHLLWQVKQRSEYFADYLAATIAGTPATLGLLSKFGLGEHLDAILLGHAYSTAQSGEYILGLFRDRIAGLPCREWERLHRASEAEGAKLDSTHPPTAFRKAFLNAHSIAEPQFAVSESAIEAVDAELRSLENKLGGRLIARYARD